MEDALTDQSVKMSDELRQALQQYLVMRKAWKTRSLAPQIGQEQMHDLLLPKGRSDSSKTGLFAAFFAAPQ